MSDSSEKPGERQELVRAHPDAVKRYERLNALFFEAREARRSGGTLPDAVRTEACDLLRWADEVVIEYLGDPANSASLVARDEAAFALALRLKDDGMLARQIRDAAADLRAMMPGVSNPSNQMPER